MRNDPLITDVNHDTSTAKGFTGPNIFISFKWDDLNIVREVARILFKMKRQTSKTCYLTCVYHLDAFSQVIKVVNEISARRP